MNNGDTVKIKETLTNDDGVRFPSGREFTVTFVHNTPSGVFCDLQDSHNDTLKWVDPRYLVAL